MGSSEKFSETSAYSISSILDEATEILVPKFQRDYSWNTENSKFNQVPELWIDISSKYNEFKQSNIDKNLEYLLGPMIFVKKGSRKFEIVDGQQRLSTLTMILCIIRDILHEFCMDNPKNSKDWKPDEDHYKWIENFESFDYNMNDELNQLKFDHKSWKLIMNRNDKMMFEEFIQKYQPDTNDNFVKNSQDQFRRISIKIEHMRKQVKDKKVTNSNKKIFKAYDYLYKKLHESLLTGFNFQIEYDEKQNEIKKEYQEKILSDMRREPNKFGLHSEFFTDSINGYDILKSKNWGEDEKTLKEAEWGKYNSTQGSNKTLTFEKWVDEIEIPEKIKIKTSDGTSLKNILDDPKKLQYLENERKTENISELKKFTRKICTKFFSVRLEVDLEDDAFQIFETVNARGQTLSKTNLIKNWILRNINEDDEDTYAQKWDNYLKPISDEDKDKFFSYSIRSRGDKDAKNEKIIFSSYKISGLPGRVKLNKDNLFKIIKRPIEDLVDSRDNEKDYEKEKDRMARAFIDDQLKKDTTIFQILKNPTKLVTSSYTTKDDRNIVPSLEDLVYLDAEYVHIILMNASRNWTLESDEFIILSKFLTMFFIRYKTLGIGNASTIEKITSSICEKIENGSNPKDDLIEIIKYVLPYDDKESFKTKLTKQKINDDTGKFILNHIVNFLESQSSDMIPDSKLEIEHILPKNPELKIEKKNWNLEKFFGNYDSSKHVYAKEFSEWHMRLGNLTLLSKEINIRARNYNFKTKLNLKDPNGNDAGYQHSKLQINELTLKNKPLVTDSIDWSKPPKELKARDDWTVNDLYERTLWLFEISSLIWKLPSITCTDQDCKNHKKSLQLPIKDIDKVNELICESCNNSLNIEWSKIVGREYFIPEEIKFQ